MIVLHTLGVIFSTLSLLPYINTSHWFVRSQSYIKAIYTVIIAILLVTLLVWGNYSWWENTFVLLFSVVIVVNLREILPYTPLHKVEIENIQKKSGNQKLSILVYNVYQFNDKYQKLIDLVKANKPDMLFLIETNQDWADGTSELKEIFQYHFEEIRENTYGLMFFSQIEIIEGGINYLVKATIPSAEVLIPFQGKMIRVLGLHPKPPVPGESTTTYYKDRELAQAARYFKAQKEDDHQILIGDLNDVAWSRASRYFKKFTGFLDPRVGRGFYATFPTWFPIKIPLDHVFCSPGLKLGQFKILENIGSDHYPVLVEFHIPD